MTSKTYSELYDFAEVIAIELDAFLDRSNPKSRLTKKIAGWPLFETLDDDDLALAKVLALNLAAQRYLPERPSHYGLEAGVAWGDPTVTVDEEPR
jgi:hypothetical protein